MIQRRNVPPRIIAFMWALMICIGLSAVYSLTIQPAAAYDRIQPDTDDHLTVYFFDVDQGDSTLFVSEDFTLLVDAGRHDRDDLVSYLNSVGIETIDLFIGTHPHADHIGQCEHVLNHFHVKEVWLSGHVHTTRTFERCIDGILASDADYHEPRAGETYDFGSMLVEVLHPKELTGHLNNDSISVRITYGQIVILMTGDAEREAEAAMVNRFQDLQANILHVGHHGSRTSSTAPFLQAVIPEIAIYSAGRDNSYGHPHAETILQFASIGTRLYGTDVHGTIVLVTDGIHYELSTEHSFPLDVAGSLPDNPGCADGQIDLNSASQQHLTDLVRIGPVLAERIAEARPFQSMEELIVVNGIGESTLQALRDQGMACIEIPS